MPESEEIEIPQFTSIEESNDFLRRVTEQVVKRQQTLETAPLDPLNEMDHRAVVAEQMLDNYHLLKVNLKTRQAIYHTLCARQASPGRQAEAYEAVNQAQAELDQCKFEILELMGVDS